MSGWEIAWIIVIAAALVLEFLAIRNPAKNDTLSFHVWKWFGIKGDPKRFVKLRRFALLVLLVWLLAHFMTGGWV